MRPSLAITALLLLAGCGGDHAPGRGDVSASEARQLDQAARDTDINASQDNGTDTTQ
jgi:hypothetical protein